MYIKLRFSSLVLAALVAWGACAGWMAIAGNTVDQATTVRTIANVFPTAEAGFAAHPLPAAN